MNGDHREDLRIALDSGNFLKEVQFETLKALLSETVEAMAAT